MEEQVQDVGTQEDRAWVLELLEQEKEIQKEDPEFDLRAVLEDNPLLRVMLASGEPLKKALSYFSMEENMSRAAREGEERILANMRKRNERPAPMGSVSQTGSVLDMRQASPEEIRRIDAMLKKGQRVFLG